MSHVEPKYTLQEIVDAAGLQASPHAGYVLDAGNRLVYCNPAWDDFAWANHGESAVAIRVLGIDVLNACPESLRFFYEQLFQYCRKTGASSFHGYHCSSPTRLRVYKMDVRCTGDFLAISNTLLEEGPHPGPAISFSQDYVHHGFTTMCSNCRRVRNVKTHQWDWVPTLIDTSEFLRLSHGLCHTCSQFYYGNEFLLRAQHLQS